MSLGFGEILVILVIAFVFVGPEDLPKIGRTLAKTLRQTKRMFADVTEEIKTEDFLGEEKKLLKTENPVSDLSEDLKRIQKEILKL